MRRATLALAAAAVALAPAAADAQRFGGYPRYYAPVGRYRAPPPAFYGRPAGRPPGYDERVFYGRRVYRDRRYERPRCRDNGAGGTIIGAIAGGLLGNAVAGRGDATAGTVVGAGAGALAGRAIDRDC